MAALKLTNQQLKDLRDEWVKNNPYPPSSQDIASMGQNKHNINMNPSTIRGRFIQMGEPLGRGSTPIRPPTPPKPAENEMDVKVEIKQVTPKEKLLVPNDLTADVPDDLKDYIPQAGMFDGYIQRPVDQRLALHYDLQGITEIGYPITGGKQGTGKTYSHMYYAHTRGLPFFIWSAYEDFNIRKLHGDKTIKNGSIMFQEGMFTRAIQSPSVVLIDEVNAISQSNIKDFNALLQNRQLHIKDADDGKGKTYKLHKYCKIGFAQNPKSAKYIGGNVRSSDFLGRCTYLTYGEFTEKQLKDAIKAKHPTLTDDDLILFVKFYREVVKAIDNSQLPFDISIRQLNNAITLWRHGMPLEDALEDGVLGITDAASQPLAKQALLQIARSTWATLK